MLIWVIGMPLLGLIILIKNRHRLEDFEFYKYFIICYQGLRTSKFYWEFLNITRKFFLVSLNSLIPETSIELKAIIGVSILLILNQLEYK
jgi:hypothetical protein